MGPLRAPFMPAVQFWGGVGVHGESILLAHLLELAFSGGHIRI
jgi:hypothetical protein